MVNMIIKKLDGDFVFIKTSNIPRIGEKVALFEFPYPIVNQVLYLYDNKKSVNHEYVQDVIEIFANKNIKLDVFVVVA